MTTKADTKIGTREEGLPRVELLEQEKELTRCSDELARRRRGLPRVRIDKEYTFQTDEGYGRWLSSSTAAHN